MHEMLEKYIDNAEQEQKAKLLKEKNDFLISKGLFKKEYSGYTTFKPDYPYREWDETLNAPKYYKKTPIEITDSEYEQLLEIERKNKPTVTVQEPNTIAKVLSVTAVIIFIAGFLAGFIGAFKEVPTTTYSYYSGYETETEAVFSFGTCIIYWAVSFISGILMLGLAEIIKLLSDIKRK